MYQPNLSQFSTKTYNRIADKKGKKVPNSVATAATGVNKSNNFVYGTTSLRVYGDVHGPVNKKVFTYVIWRTFPCHEKNEIMCQRCGKNKRHCGVVSRKLILVISFLVLTLFLLAVSCIILYTWFV